MMEGWMELGQHPVQWWNSVFFYYTVS